MFECHSVLLVCSGNGYRSRFAEALFNFEAEKRDLELQALSREFHPHLATGNLSSDAETALESRGIPRRHARPEPELGIDVETSSQALLKLERKVLPLVGILEDGHPDGCRKPLALEF